MSVSKKFTYKDYTFSIKVTTRQERRPNGRITHKLQIHCIDYDNYYVKSKCGNDALIDSITLLEANAKRHIDKKDEKLNKIDMRLLAMGFK